ncbi:MAG: VanZ family protein [Ruminococcaceae bacterium]|nr:VanZ family protein [Oscillospiraceae bacterium]
MKKCKNKTKTRCYLFLGLALAVTAFIISQSLKNGAQSGAMSHSIAAFLKPLLDPGNRFSEAGFHLFLRKAGHFTEFFALGLCWGGFAYHLGKLKGRGYIALPMLLTVSTAVADEFVQFFVGRGSMVTDVVLDISGAMTGLLIVFVINLLVRRKGA